MKSGSRLDRCLRLGVRATLVVAVAFLEPARADTEKALPPSDACDTYAPPRLSGRVPGPLDELSGLVASRVHDGLYWAHNDSGNPFEILAIDATGAVRARFPLRGTNRDIEDIAVGPCTEGSARSCVYLGDIGDNRYRHDEGRIYRFPEPESLDGRLLEVETLRFRWPDGARNAEAMVVEPGTARVFVWTKESDSLGVVHRLDGLGTSEVARAVPVTEIHGGDRGAVLPTAADVHPSGERILIRTYNQAWELRRAGATRLEEVLEAEPVRVPSSSQRQAEAIGYTHDGRGYLMGTEGAGGPLYEVGCASSAEGSSRSSS